MDDYEVNSTSTEHRFRNVMKRAVEAGHTQRLFEMTTLSAVATSLFGESTSESPSSSSINSPLLAEFLSSTSENIAISNQKYRMIQKIASQSKWEEFNQGTIVFPGDSHKREQKKLKAFECMVISSQVLGLGTMYSKMHNDELIRNNFKFIRHSWSELTEAYQRLIEEKLKQIGVKVQDYKSEVSKANIKGKWKSLVLAGSEEQMFDQIKTMIRTMQIPAEVLRSFRYEPNLV